MDKLLEIVQILNGYLTDYILIFLLMGAGIIFSFKTRFVQVRCFGEGMRKVFGNLTLKGKKNESGLTPFQALATAIAAQVGTGNIVGASGAILTGGPGAIFWMWVIAFFGMATIYVEATLAQKTRVVKEDGSILGGPVYYIKTAFKGKFGKFLAGFFAVAISPGSPFSGVFGSTCLYALAAASAVCAGIRQIINTAIKTQHTVLLKVKLLIITNPFQLLLKNQT